MQKTELICNNFSGINRTTAIYSSSIITAGDMQNVELFPTKVNSGVGIRTMKGNISVCENLPDDETIINMFESVQNGVTLFFVHTENAEEGKIYQYFKASQTLELKVSNLTVTGKSCGCDVSQGWSDLFVFSNSEELLTIEIGKTDEHDEPDEIEFLNLQDGDGRTIKGMGCVVFSGRLWIFSSQVLWYSMRENIYDFSTSDAELTTSAGYIEFVKKITAIYPYLGTLAVFHKNSSCLIAESEDGVFSKTMESPGGCAGHDSLVFHGTELYFYDDTKKGVFCFLQIINGDKTLGNNIALDIQEELFDIPANRIGEIRTLSVVTSDRNEVWFLLPSDDPSYSTIAIFDYIRKSWVKRKSQKINCFATIGGVLYSGGRKIFQEYTSSFFDGEFIPSYYNCSPLNLGVENSVKHIAFPPKITMDIKYANSFYVTYTKNYDGQTAKTRYIKAKSSKHSLYYDIGHWDVEYFPVKDMNSIKKLPSAFFKTLQITFDTRSAGDEFCIKNIEFGKIKVKQG